MLVPSVSSSTLKASSSCGEIGDVQPLAGRQPRDEPFVVERNQVAVGAELAEGALDHRRSCGSPLRNMMP